MLATKVYGGMSDWPNDTFLSARNIVRACDASLRRMQTDWIDLYQFHHVDLRTPWEEIWQACETLVAQGKVLYVGSSNHAAWQIAAANEAAARRQLPWAWSASSRTTTCSPGTSSSRCCRPRSTTASASSRGARWPAACWPGSWRRPQGDGAATRNTQKRVERNRAALEEYEAFCRELGAAPADVGVAWLLHQPAVTAPIIGPRTMEQFEGALAALELSLDEAALARLDEIFPGYKAAPMEYAW